MVWWESKRANSRKSEDNETPHCSRPPFDAYGIGVGGWWHGIGAARPARILLRSFFVLRGSKDEEKSESKKEKYAFMTELRIRIVLKKGAHHTTLQLVKHGTNNVNRSTSRATTHRVPSSSNGSELLAF